MADHVGRLGSLPAIGLRGLATLSRAPARPGNRGYYGPTDFWNDRHGEGFGLVGFEGEGVANRAAEAVTGPLWKRHTHAAQDTVQAPQRALFWSG